MRSLLRMLSAMVLGVFALLPISGVKGHGRLIEPPSRSTMWRYGFKTERNYNDNELFCGGFTRQWQRNGGKCGVCGDPWDMATPRPNEAGGKYARGVIARSYGMGEVITAVAQLTANHRGYFEFKLCPVNNPLMEATDECMNQHPLEIVDSDGGQRGGTKYIVPNGKSQKFVVKLRLPENMTCTQCVFQWTYTAGNNWGKCEDGRSAVGCGPQEMFRGCSDIAIVDENAPPPTIQPPRYKPSKKPTQWSTKGTEFTNAIDDWNSKTTKYYATTPSPGGWHNTGGYWTQKTTASPGGWHNAGGYWTQKPWNITTTRAHGNRWPPTTSKPSWNSWTTAQQPFWTRYATPSRRPASTRPTYQPTHMPTPEFEGENPHVTRYTASPSYSYTQPRPVPEHPMVHHATSTKKPQGPPLYFPQEPPMVFPDDENEILTSSVKPIGMPETTIADEVTKTTYGHMAPPVSPDMEDEQDTNVISDDVHKRRKIKPQVRPGGQYPSPVPEHPNVHYTPKWQHGTKKPRGTRWPYTIEGSESEHHHEHHPPPEDTGNGNEIDQPPAPEQPRQQHCSGVGVYKRMPGIEKWCADNCLHIPSFCPQTHCQCA